LYFNKYDLESLNYENVFMGNYPGWDMDYSFYYAISDNDERFALSTGKELFIYDVVNKRLLRDFDYKTKTDVKNNIVFSKDGSYLFYAKIKYFSDVIGIIDTKKNEEINAFSGHSSKITSIALHPNGKYIASGGEDNRVIIWDIKTGKPIKYYTGHTDDVNNLAFSGDGRFLFSCSDDKTIRKWDLTKAFPDLENTAMEYDIEKGLKKYFDEEKDVEIRLIENTFMQPEGNETYLEYKKRTEAADAEKKLIEEKYEKKFNELRRQKLEEQEKRKK
jgi:WD40 repeat protein